MGKASSAYSNERVWLETAPCSSIPDCRMLAVGAELLRRVVEIERKRLGTSRHGCWSLSLEMRLIVEDLEGIKLTF